MRWTAGQDEPPLDAPPNGQACWKVSGVIEVSWFTRLPLFEPRWFPREDQALAAASAELVKVWRRPPETAGRHALRYRVELELGTFIGNSWHPSHNVGTAHLDPRTGALAWSYRPRRRPWRPFTLRLAVA